MSASACLLACLVCHGIAGRVHEGPAHGWIAESSVWLGPEQLGRTLDDNRVWIGFVAVLDTMAADALVFINAKVWDTRAGSQWTSFDLFDTNLSSSLVTGVKSSHALSLHAFFFSRAVSTIIAIKIRNTLDFLTLVFEGIAVLS